MSLRFQDADLKFYFDNDKIDEIIVQSEGVSDYGISIYKISSSKLIEIARI
jgi:hypothetical protein